MDLELFYLEPRSSVSEVPGCKGGDVTRQSWVEMREPGERRRTPLVASWRGPNVYALPPPHHISKP